MKRMYITIGTLTLLCGILNSREELHRAHVVVLESNHMDNPGAGIFNTAPEFKPMESNIILQADTMNAARHLLEKHLDAVVQKDSLTLKSTIKMGAEYKLILPDGSTMETAQAFYHMHMEWFKEPNWSMEMKILQFSEKGDFAAAVVVADYREPDRNGKPYHHKMWITYILEQVDGDWFVVHDHASTAEKTES